MIDRHAVELTGFDLESLDLRNTVSAICVGHGLRAEDLADPERFPLRRDIHFQPVNVRLLAILLRLGDLLDMDSDRACPLILNAVDRMPSSSVVHWSQYHSISHRLFTADRIEVSADCDTAEEYRVLSDWCQWIVREVNAAPTLLAGSDRHSAWRAPIATMGIPGASISIRPSASARFLPLKWEFTLDPDAVYERFIRDSYDEPLAFIRELLQNALDANRCAMYAAKTGQLPELPTDFPKEVRDRYPVTVTLTTTSDTNHLTGEPQAVQLLTIDDTGVGMDAEVITNYLLQVGRSYYQTDEFRRNYGFIPTSRFGVGFLSVFSISDDVQVDTYRPASEDGAILLRLSGPRNYLITERSDRAKSGTSVSVKLREPLSPGEVTAYLRELCLNVEFQILVDDLGDRTTIESSLTNHIEGPVESATVDGAYFEIKEFPIRVGGLIGCIFVFTYTDSSGESWTSKDWAVDHYSVSNPDAFIPQLPSSSTASHGIRIRHSRMYGRDEALSWIARSIRLDLRSAAPALTTARTSLASRFESELSATVDGILTDIVLTHISSGHEGEDQWPYRAELIFSFDLHNGAARLPGTVPAFRHGRRTTLSLQEIADEPAVTILARLDHKLLEPSEIELVHGKGARAVVLDEAELQRVWWIRPFLLSGRRPENIRLLENSVYSEWTHKPVTTMVHEFEHRSLTVATFTNVKSIGAVLLGGSGTRGIPVLNSSSLLGEWFTAVCEAYNAGFVSKEQYQRLVGALHDAIDYGQIERLNAFMRGWANSSMERIVPVPKLNGTITARHFGWHPTVKAL